MTTETAAELPVAAPPGNGLYAWYVVMVLMMAQMFSFIDRMIMGLLVGPIRTSFNISDTQFSLLAGLAFAIFYAVMGLPLARIADRRSRRVLIAIGISFWSVMTTLCGFAQGFWSLFAARVGVGVGEAALGPAAYSMITDYFPKKSLARALSVYTIGVTVGSGLAYIIGGKIVHYALSLGTIDIPLLGHTEGWQITFFAVGFPGILIALLMMTVREPARRGRIQAPGTLATATPPAIPVREVVAFLVARKGAFLSHILGVSIYIMAVFSLNIWGPEYLIRTFGFARADAGLTFGIVMIVMGTSGLMCGGLLADRWFSRSTFDAYSRVIILSMLCMLPFAAMLGFANSVTLGIICLSGAIFFSAFQGGIAGGVIQLMVPNEMRGQAVALYFLIANLVGLGFGPTVVAAMTDYVFKDDAALNKSLALTSATLIPLAAVILLSGLGKVREAVRSAQEWTT
ncbi:spinster family MFS transporter [Hyphomonas sp.]|uniref:spinster family MFS transporter n=1 Tax=Hyphomonas sp. TaxID=87 RepID=UPI003563D35F